MTLTIQISIYTFTTLIISLSLSHAKVVKHKLIISYIDGSPDGVYKDHYFAINGQFPGPTIEANIRDTVEVEVINRIQDGQNVSIHWHGIHQQSSPFEDGASMISQCPLKNNETQVYRFHVTQAGTFWYHSHVGSQYTEGLWGVLIVHNRPELYAYDDEIVITLTDWYHRSAHENEAWHLSAPARGVPPYPDGGLLNGRGRYNCSYATLQNRTCSSQLQTRPVFRVQPGLTYRVRVVSVSAYAAFNFSIEGFRLRPIEVDGIDVASEQEEVDSVFVAAAQRYSFLVRMEEGRFIDGRALIRADLQTQILLLIPEININQYPEAIMPDITGVLELVPRGFQGQVESHEAHSYLSPVPPIVKGGNWTELDDYFLKPYGGARSQAPDYYDKEVVIEVGFYEDFEDVRRGAINQSYFKVPEDKPMLMKLIDGEPLPASTISVDVNQLDVIQLVINHPFFGPHPFHLHGAHFWVMGKGAPHAGNYSRELDGLTLRRDGVYRETFLVEELSWAVIRFVAEEVGVMTFHCHIDWHLLTGMSMTFIVERQKIREELRVPEEARRVCQMWGVGVGVESRGAFGFGSNLWVIGLSVGFSLISSRSNFIFGKKFS